MRGGVLVGDGDLLGDFVGDLARSGRSDAGFGWVFYFILDS